MAEIDDGLVMQLLQQLIANKSAPASKSWQSYGGITKGPVTLIDQARSQISNFLSGFGTLGQIAAPHISQWITGTDFNKTGTLNNPLSGLLAPGGGTYANAYQQMFNNQTLRILQGQRKAIQQNLRKDFYTNYYTLTGAPDVNNKALNKSVSFPAALQFAFDPARNERILQGIKNTQAGFLYWQDRVNAGQSPLLGGDFSARTGAAQILGKSVAEWAMQANSWQLGAVKGGYKNSYGGFTGAQVSQLTSILANASNVFGTDPSKINQAVKQLGDKVKGLTQALAPLKDIFGTDVKAMVDMIQSVTGQNINQLSPLMVSSIANSTVDMARYSGATVTQIAQAGQRIFMQTSQLGGNTFSRIGGGLTGAYYSGLLAQGNTPAGVHAAQYAGSTQRSLASAQASAGVDWTAMAYGIWQQKHPGGSVQDFMTAVRRNRGSGTMLDAVIRTAGVRNQTGLLRGLSTVGYRTSLQSGLLAQLGVEAQYQTQLADAIVAMKLSNTDRSIRASEWDKLGRFMSSDANAVFVKDLVTNANDENAVANFARRAGVSTAAVNKFINSAGMLQYASRWASSVELAEYTRSQDKIREATKEIGAFGTGGLLTFWRAASTMDLAALKKSGRLAVGEGGVDTRTIQAQGRAILGTGDLNEMKKRIQNLGEHAADILALAGGQFSTDAQFVKRVQRVAQGGKAEKEDLGYLEARRLRYLGSNASFKDPIAAKIQKEALESFKDSKNSQVLSAQLGRALRIENLTQMSTFQLGLTGEGADKKRDAILKALKKDSEGKIAELLKVQGTDYSKQAEDLGLKGISKQDLKQAYQAAGVNYNNQTDIGRMTVTLLQMLMSWLKENFKATTRERT